MTASDPSVGAFVVTWNRPEQLRRTLEKLLRQTWPPDAIYVVDNGDDDAASRIAREVGKGSIECRRTGDNLGAAGGVAFGMTWLAGLGFDWILVNDDDDPPYREDILERLRRLIRRHREDTRLGGVARTGQRWDWRRGRGVAVPSSELHGDVSFDVTATGQQFMIRREVIETVGTFREEMFWGGEAEMFCLRMLAAGWRLLADGELCAQTAVHKAAGGQGPRGPIRRHLHRWDPWRGYYSTRGYIAEMRGTFDRPDLARREVGRAALRSVVAWLGGPRHGIDVARLQARAVMDAYRGRLGRTIDPIPKARDLQHD